MTRRLLFAAVLALAGGGCATVAPWERGDLAKPHVAMEPCQGIATYRAHVHASREAAPPAAAAGEAGCGCY